MRRRIIAFTFALTLILAPATALSSAATPAQSPSDFACADVEEIPTAECQALVDLYESTNGPQWPIQGAWLVTPTPCTTPWLGIACADGHVVSLDRSTNNLGGLVGPLPASLGDLSALQVLKLAGNELSGPIPPELGNLASLQVLNLADNHLRGAIPASLGNLNRIETLLLWSNELSGTVPVELGALPAVQSLVLTGNQLTGAIPPELGQLATLRELGLGANGLTGAIPAELGGLAELRRLILSRNQISGTIPISLTQLANLEDLWLDGNQLDGLIPPEMGELTGLRKLALSRNRLSGPIPAELAGLTALQELWVDSNRLEGAIPEALCELKDLFDFYVAYNTLNAAPPCLVTLDPLWAQTQTVAPSGLQATASPAGAITLSWDPILYTHDTGHYEISYAPEGGPYAMHGVTADKSTSTYSIDGLAPGVYTVRLRTFTAAHNVAPAFQSNDLWSAYTPPVNVTVGDPEPAMHKLHLPWIEVAPTGE